MKNIFIVISSILVLTSPIVYIHSIIRGSTRPHRTTRFVVLVITFVSAWSLYQNKGAGFWLALASAVQAAAVFGVSIKIGMGGWSRLDISCLIVALIGVVVWRSTGQPIIGLYASILADFIGYIPATVKTYYHPHTEDWRFFAIDTVAAVFSIAAVTQFSALDLGYPIYIFLANFWMVLLIVGRHKHLAQAKKSI